MSMPTVAVAGDRSRHALTLSTAAFTICFAVWTICSIIGIQIKHDLALSDTRFGLLVGMRIPTGSLVRIVLGTATDRRGRAAGLYADHAVGGASDVRLSWATTYVQMLVAALGVGIAGNSFAVGVAYVSRFFDSTRQGTALGIFGVGNIGAAVTKFLAPVVMLSLGWQATA